MTNKYEDDFFPMMINLEIKGWEGTVPDKMHKIKMLILTSFYKPHLTFYMTSFGSMALKANFATIRQEMV